MIKKYGFIGLGDMGKPMVSNLLNSLKKIFVYDIDNLSNKAPSGSIISNSIKELVANSEIIFISVPDGKAVKDVIDKILSSNFNMVKAIINLSNSLSNNGTLLVSFWSKEKKYGTDTNIIKNKCDYRDFNVGPNYVKWKLNSNNIINRFYYIHDNNSIINLAKSIGLNYIINWELQNWFILFYK